MQTVRNNLAVLKMCKNKLTERDGSKAADLSHWKWMEFAGLLVKESVHKPIFHLIKLFFMGEQVNNSDIVIHVH